VVEPPISAIARAITLAPPGKAERLDAKWSMQLSAACRRGSSGCRLARVAILTGEGKAFSAGGDIAPGPGSMLENSAMALGALRAPMSSMRWRA
jgi:enoyl-CoA hydratase/carnithine racemase